MFHVRSTLHTKYTFNTDKEGYYFTLTEINCEVNNMNHTYRVLKGEIDFFVAAIRQDKVAVWHVMEDQETMIDHGGVVEQYTPLAIKILGKRFFRETFEFRVTK